MAIDIVIDSKIDLIIDLLLGVLWSELIWLIDLACVASSYEHMQLFLA
jgi:hypothetical protein